MFEPINVSHQGALHLPPLLGGQPSNQQTIGTIVTATANQHE